MTEPTRAMVDAVNGAIEAIERGSSTAPVVECLKAALLAAEAAEPRPAVGEEEIARVSRHFIETALWWQPVFEDGRGGNDLTITQTADLICGRLSRAVLAILSPDKEPMAVPERKSE